MSSSVRIARLAGNKFRPTGSGDPFDNHAALVELIRRHLPGVTGSLLATPRRIGDAGEVEWYSDQAGQPAALPTLPEADQQVIRKLLADRIASVQRLAERLPQVDPGSAHLAEALRQAVVYPGDEQVYVIGGQPVLTFWGYTDPTRPPAPVPVAAPVPGGGRFPWLWLVLALGLAALAALLYWYLYLRQPEEPKVVVPPAPDFAAMLADASGDCTKLAILAVRLEGITDPPGMDLTPIRYALQKELKACQAPDYRRLLNEAGDDCAALSALQLKLRTPEYPDAPELPEVRNELTNLLGTCRIQELVQEFEQVKNDCNQLKQFGSKLQAADYRDAPELLAVRNELARSLGACRMQELRQEFELVKKDCKQLKQFGSKLQAADTTLDGYDQLKADMQPSLEECNKPKSDPTALCPNERPKELAPELVLVFDASGSMDYPLIPDEQIERTILQRAPLALLNPALLENAMRQQFGSTEKRVDVAKQASRRLVDDLPGDVDIGLVLIKDCPQAQKVGFYPPSQRSKLLRDIKAIAPNRKTPLASGIQVGGSMIDGVKKPALMVVISDGKETCGADPCAVARQLASRKPKLKVNVVDILGTGAGNCVAHATNGKVWTANNASELASMLEYAAADVQGPAHCRKK